MKALTVEIKVTEMEIFESLTYLIKDILTDERINLNIREEHRKELDEIMKELPK